MKITDKTVSGRVMLRELYSGDVFKFEDDIYIRSQSMRSEEFGSCAVLCINIDDGDAIWITESEWVTPLTAEVIVTNKEG